jgi:diguanylate cyclase (GGDEF)-like protein
MQAGGDSPTGSTIDPALLEERERAIEAERSAPDRFGDIGLPTEAGWYVSSGLYWIAGLAIVLIDQLAVPGTVDPVIAMLGAIALAASPLMLLGARFTPDAAWGAPVRLLFPVVFFTIGAFVAGAAISALGLFYLFPLLAVAYMHRPSVSIPFCSLSIVGMVIALAVHDGSSAGLAHAIIFLGVVTSLVTALIVSQMRLRSAAAVSRELAVTDPLTGLVNLRGLRSHLQQEVRRSARDGSEIVVLGIDLDNFKEVNERFSYALGDAVLQAVADAIKQELGPGDLATRRGGDEFAIVALATPDRHMARFADRIAAAIERTRRTACPTVDPRASITRVTRLPDETAEALLLRVDDGLHEAKLDAHPERDDQQGIKGPLAEAGGDEHFERMLEGARRTQLSVVSAREGDLAATWRMIAGVALVCATLIAAVVIPGLLPDAQNAVTLGAVIGLLVTAFASQRAGRVCARRAFMLIPLVAILLLVAATIAAAGPDGFVLAELCILPVPLAVVALGWRSAIPVIVIAGTTYAWFVLSSGTELATLQTCILLGVTAILSAMLDRAARLAAEFAAASATLALIDPLTGAANLRGLKQRVQQEVVRSNATGGTPCLMMVDLECFKQVNDRHNHSVGDLLLIETARAIEAVVRDDELVARRGGDEFAIVCVATGARDMESVAQRVRNAARSARVRITPDTVAGARVATVFLEHDESAEEFMLRADQALQLAKSLEQGAPC